MARCGAPHPEDPDRTCIDSEMVLHADHSDRQGTWPNVEVQERMAALSKHKPRTRTEGTRSLNLLAGAVSRDRLTNLDDERRQRREGYQPPIVRAGDPASAHEAAARYQPKRNTAKGRVLAYLQQHIGEWVDAPVLGTPEVGGFAGTRRLRELRDAGWPIETRPKPGHTNTWQHRLLRE